MKEDVRLFKIKRERKHCKRLALVNKNCTLMSNRRKMSWQSVPQQQESSESVDVLEIQVECNSACSSSFFNPKTSRFVEKNAAEKQIEDLRRDERQESLCRPRSDIHDKRMIAAVERFQSALNKKHLEEKYAETLDLLDWAQKAYQKQLVLETSTMPPLKVMMCPPVDKVIQRDQQCEMESLAEKALRSTKEHAIEDLEGYCDDVEKHFQRKKSRERVEHRESVDTLSSFSSLVKTDSFIEKYFDSRKVREEIVAKPRPVFNSPIQPSPPASTSQGLGRGAPPAVRESSEKRNIAIQVKPTLSSTCVQTEIKDRSGVERDKVRVVRAKDTRDATDPTQERRKYITSARKLLAKINSDRAIQNSASGSITSSTEYYSPPPTIGKVIPVFSTFARHSEDKAEESPAIVPPIGEDLLRTVSRPESEDVAQTTHQFPPISDIVPSIPNLSSYLQQLSSRFAAKPENRASEPPLQAIALSEPIRKRPISREKKGKSFEEVNLIHLPRPLTSENIVKECQRGYLINESIRKVMSAAKNDQDGYVAEESSSGQPESDVSLGLPFSSDDSLKRGTTDVSLLVNLSQSDSTRKSDALQVGQVENLKTVLDGRPRQFNVSLESRFSSSHERANDYKENNQTATAAEQPNDGPFIYHELSTIQEVDSTLTDISETVRVESSVPPLKSSGVRDILKSGFYPLGIQERPSLNEVSHAEPSSVSDVHGSKTNRRGYHLKPQSNYFTPLTDEKLQKGERFLYELMNVPVASGSNSVSEIGTDISLNKKKEAQITGASIRTNNLLIDAANGMVNSLSSVKQQSFQLLSPSSSISVSQACHSASHSLSGSSSHRLKSPTSVNGSYTSFQPLSLVLDGESSSSTSSLGKVKATRSPNFDNLFTRKRTVSEITSIPMEKQQEKTESGSSCSAESFKPLSLIWDESKHTSSSFSVLKPHQHCTTTDLNSKSTFQPLTLVTESSNHLVNESEKDSNTASSVSSNATPSFNKDASAKDQKGPFCSSSEDNLSEMFTGSKILHQSTPIKSYEELVEEKGILDEPDLTLVGSEASIDSTSCDVPFLQKTVFASSSLDNEETVRESRHVLSDDPACQEERLLSDSIQSFLQHELSSENATDEEVSLLCLPGITSDKETFGQKK